MIEKLQGLGYSDCVTIDFPAVKRATKVKSLDEDIAAVKEAVVPRIENGGEVMVICHSWAGVPVSSALVSLGKEEREKEGKKGGVLSLCYIASFLPLKGESVISGIHGRPEWHHVAVSPIAQGF